MTKLFKVILTITPGSNKKPFLEFKPKGIGSNPSKEILFECISAFLTVAGDMVGWLASVHQDTPEEQEKIIKGLQEEFAKNVKDGREIWDKKGKISTAIH